MNEGFRTLHVVEDGAKELASGRQIEISYFAYQTEPMQYRARDLAAMITGELQSDNPMIRIIYPENEPAHHVNPVFAAVEDMTEIAQDVELLEAYRQEYTSGDQPIVTEVSKAAYVEELIEKYAMPPALAEAFVDQMPTDMLHSLLILPVGSDHPMGSQWITTVVSIKRDIGEKDLTTPHSVFVIQFRDQTLPQNVTLSGGKRNGWDAYKAKLAGLGLTPRE